MPTEITKLPSDPRDGRQRYLIALDTVMQSEPILQFIFREIAAEVAKKFVAEHYVEIAAMLDPRAIANLSIAEGAAKIHETLATKLPDKVLEAVRTQTEVYQRGIFGGMDRIR